MKRYTEDDFGGEVLLTLPDDSGTRKGLPICTGVLDYFPAAIAYVAKISKFGNDKHNPGEPLHHARGKSMDHADCLVRHQLDRGGSDDHGIRHSGYVAWRALAQLQEELEAAGEAPLPRGARLPAAPDVPEGERPGALTTLEQLQQEVDPYLLLHPGGEGLGPDPGKVREESIPTFGPTKIPTFELDDPAGYVPARIYDPASCVQTRLPKPEIIELDGKRYRVIAKRVPHEGETFLGQDGILSDGGVIMDINGGVRKILRRELPAFTVKSVPESQLPDGASYRQEDA